jgi:hypothetical protein
MFRNLLLVPQSPYMSLKLHVALALFTQLRTPAAEPDKVSPLAGV